MSSLFGAPGPYGLDPKSPPPACENTGPHRPLLCYYCNRLPAVQLLGFGGFDRMRVFCTAHCAALNGLYDFSLTFTKQCDFCGGWTNDNGECETCDLRVTPTEQKAILDEIESTFVKEGNTHDQE